MISCVPKDFVVTHTRVSIERIQYYSMSIIVTFKSCEVNNSYAKLAVGFVKPVTVGLESTVNDGTTTSTVSFLNANPPVIFTIYVPVK